MHRRDFLAAAGAVALSPRFAWASVPTTLVAEPVSAQILSPDQPATPSLGFNGRTPGPVLRVRQGEYIDVKFRNQTGEGSALHWHGLRSDNAMDGVPELTQELVESGAEFDYRFRAPDAGTFWYHSHHHSWEQVAKGLYGPLIVDEATPPDVDHDLVVMIDDWRLTEAGTIADDFESLFDRTHQGRLGNFARALIEPSRTVRRGDRLRLRLINVATDRVFGIDLTGVEGWVVALDGMPLREPQDVSDLMLAPAQRADIVADVVARELVEILFLTRDEPYVLGEIIVDGDNNARRRTAISPLPPNVLPRPNRGDSLALTVTMEGGAMSSRMMSESEIWAFNGQSGLSDTPLYRFERNQTARISLVNDTFFPHGIHLHGHHFFEVDPGPTLGALRDTTLVDPRETREIVCVFDNPGKWLLHCHMLGHQASGMTTWVEVA